MTDPLAKWQATDLRDEMIDCLHGKDINLEGCLYRISKSDCARLSEAILELLERSEANAPIDALEEFGKQCAAEFKRKGFLHATDRAIPLDIVKAIQE